MHHFFILLLPSLTHVVASLISLVAFFIVIKLNVPFVENEPDNRKLVISIQGSQYKYLLEPLLAVVATLFLKMELMKIIWATYYNADF